jgi:hypothetical protein
MQTMPPPPLKPAQIAYPLPVPLKLPSTFLHVLRFDLPEIVERIASALAVHADSIELSFHWQYAAPTLTSEP